MIARSEEEQKILREGGRRLAGVLATVAATVRPGVTLRELNDLAERLIAETGGAPSFKGYQPHLAACPYPSTLCCSVNEEVVHGIGNRDIALQRGDIVGLDIGMKWPAGQVSNVNGQVSGLYTDTATTVGVGKISKEARRLMAVTAEALGAGIAAARVGSRLSDVARAVQTTAEGAGFSVVRELVGHGVGRSAHEDPQVPNFWDEHQIDSVLLDGMVIAIEPMITAGTWRVRVRPDGWTIVTADGSLSAHFEHTVLITKQGAEVLTRTE
ncbi:MAG: type I methionyl aminopeptidase [Candidatus Uhrbacteria bacterium]